ncbi:hypothetical protein RhiTH_002668 [Rhizoctonia solani]
MSEPVPGPSTVSQCALCSQPSKYTCPRCSVKTCSLVCSKSHKSKDNCSGERDKAKYVPMNEYGWGALADDYSYLEDLGRNVATWGRDLSKGKGKWKGRSPKLEALRVQLATRDIKIQFVAEGMEKRRLNQSSWDPRTKTINLTVEFIFHLQGSQPIRILTHRNNLSAPLETSLASHLKHKSDVPADILSLMTTNGSQILYTIARNQLPGQETKYQAPTLAIRLGSTSAAARPKIRKVFYPLDPNRSLQECLKGQEMVEYPTIDVFASKTVFLASRLGELGENGVEIREEPPLKKRKTDTGIGGLVGYGDDSQSDSDVSHGAGSEEEGIGILGGYESAEDVDEGLGESLDSNNHSS